MNRAAAAANSKKLPRDGVDIESQKIVKFKC